MSNAWQVSEEDLKDVLSSNIVIGPNSTIDEYPNLQKLAEELMPRLDMQSVEEAALQGDDLDQQRDYAADEITSQLVRMKALIRMPLVVPRTANVAFVLCHSNPTAKLAELAVNEPSQPLAETIRQNLEWVDVLAEASTALSMEEAASAANAEIKRQLETKGYVEGPADSEAPVELNAFQRAVLTRYAMGEFEHLAEPMSQKAFDEELARSGDGLLRYLVVELATSEGCTDEAEALRRIETTLDEVHAMRGAIEELAEQAHLPQADRPQAPRG